MARPSEYSQEVVSAICERLADGESLRAICAAEEMPAKSSVFKWLTIHKEFADQYARAREAQADALFDEILDIADDGTNDSYQDEDGQVRTNQDVIARSRLRVDARKWMAGKLRPKVYGEKLDLNHTGAIARPVTDMTDDDLAAIAAGSSARTAGAA